MASVGSHEAKDQLSRLLDRVAKGQEITITKHGTPVARLVPVGAVSRCEARETIRRLKEFRCGRTLGELKLREMIREGRRY